MILEIFSKLNILFEAQQLQEVCKLLTQIIANFSFFLQKVWLTSKTFMKMTVLVMKYWINFASIS